MSVGVNASETRNDFNARICGSHIGARDGYVAGRLELY